MFVLATTACWSFWTSRQTISYNSCPLGVKVKNFCRLSSKLFSTVIRSFSIRAFKVFLAVGFSIARLCEISMSSGLMFSDIA